MLYSQFDNCIQDSNIIACLFLKKCAMSKYKKQSTMHDLKNQVIVLLLHNFDALFYLLIKRVLSVVVVSSCC